MSSFILKGIITALLVTALTLLAGMVWSAMGLGGLSVAGFLDVGLFLSCLIGGYRTAKESKVWLLGGVTGAGYVTVGTLLLALFLPIRGLGFIQVLAEGVTIGLVAGAVGAGGTKGVVLGARQGRRSNFRYTPSYAGYDITQNDQDDQFEWDTEDKAQFVKNEPTADWVDGLEDESREKLEVKQDLKDSQDIEWSWDRELNSIEETDSIWDDVPEENRMIKNHFGESKEGKTRPWWEE